MGNTWEVWGWVEQPDGELRRYDYISFYSGESFFGPSCFRWVICARTGRLAFRATTNRQKLGGWHE